jgi:uncharacterized membrane protein
MQVGELLHLLGVVVWVGGMFFAYMALRPAAAEMLEPPARLKLWNASFARFFPWVWVSVGLVLASGLWMIDLMGGWANLGLYAWAMFGIGVAMMLIFGHVFFAPYRRLARAVAAEDWKAGGAALAQIRMMVGVNLSLGLLNIAVGTVGPLMG